MSRRIRRGRWPWAAAVVALGAATLGLPLGTGTSGAAPPPVRAEALGPDGVLPAEGSWSVTLLTGDVVDVRTDAEGRVLAGIPEPTGPYRSYRTPEGELYMIPLSVTTLLAQVLDRELFNVTGLVRQGYDDAATDAIPLIVQRAGGVDVARTLGAEGERPLPSIGAVATGVTKADAAATGDLLAELSAAADPEARAVAGITKVWLDRRTHVQALPAAPAQAPPAGNLTQIGADRAWADGLSGAGTTVAVLDTGVDATHPDLAGRVAAEGNFGGGTDVVDRFGHGTHVASIAAGSGAASGGEHSGVAPAAQLISGKVLDDSGFGMESQAIAGMEWAAPQADVVNMSLGYGLGSDGSDPMSQAVDALTAQHGALFVIAAGNSGPGGGTVEFPGAADRALTVGAVDGQDALADFSSRGPLVGSYELKPEVAAPGVEVVAARAAEGVLGEPVDEHHVAMSGTSMAAPHAAGSALLLAQQHPDWTADQLKNALVGTADPIGGDSYERGAGRLDVGDAADAVTLAGQDVVDALLPPPRSEPHEATVSWANTGTAPVTLELSGDLEDRAGDPVDAFTVEPASLTVAPGATGTAAVEIDAPALAKGLYTGTVVADPVGGPAGDDIRTPVGLFAAPEMVDMTIEATAPPGAAPGPPVSFASIVNLDDYAEFSGLFFFEDTLTILVPAGTYAVLGDVSTGDRTASAVAQVGDPELVVDAATTVAFDGSGDARTFAPTVPGFDAVPPDESGAYLLSTPRAGAGGYGVGLVTYTFEPMAPLRVAPMTGDPELFEAFQIYRLQEKALTTTVRSGGSSEELDVRPTRGTTVAQTLRVRAFDGGDGSDLADAAGRLAVVQLPADPDEMARVTQRADAAEAAALVFVDESRSFLTVAPSSPTVRWAWDLPTVAAGGESATRLLAAGRAGERVVLRAHASRQVFDIVSPSVAEVDPEPVIDGEWRASLATLRERFHRDPDGLGTTGDRRYPTSVDLVGLDSAGPVPAHRTAHVTPGVNWLSMAMGRGWFRDPRDPEAEPEPSDQTAMAFDLGRVYEAGSRQTLGWLSRPLWPGPVGAPWAGSGCQPSPVQRTETTFEVWLAPFQDRRDGYSCGDPHTARLVLERDGVVVGESDGYYGEFAVDPGPGAFRLSYEQTGFDPYPHRSSSVWTFPSAGAGLLPLLVVDYDLPLDAHNRPTGRKATFTVDQVTGVPDAAIADLDVWTSIDGGTSWQVAPVSPRRDGRFEVTLPGPADGTAVSLRVDARDAAGSRLEQTLHDTYIA